MQLKHKAYIELTFAMFIAGSSVVVSKILVKSLPIFLASECSLLIALTILLPLNSKRKRDTPKLGPSTVRILFLQAVTGVFLFRVLLFYGLKFTSAIDSGLITSTSPALIGILAYFILKEKLHLNKVIGIVFVVIGISVVNFYSSSVSASTNNSSIIGNALILTAIVGESLFSVLSKINKVPISPIYRTTLITAFSAVCFIPFSIYDLVHFNWRSVNYTAFLSVLYYGTFISVVSYILWFRGISKVSASSAAVFAGVMPISSTLLSLLLLKEEILPSHIISLILILVGIYFSCSNKHN